MAILIGVDEAGYGPNYGPLVVAATAWRVEEKVEGGRRKAEGRNAAPAPIPDLYKLLRNAVARSADRAGRKLAIADSKALYKAGFGVHQLERGVLAALAAMGPPENEAACIERVAELVDATSADPLHRRRDLACHFDDDQPLPLAVDAAEVCRLAGKLRQACAENGVRLLAIRATLVYPTEFNALVEQCGNKGAALSHVTLGLVRRVVDEVEGNAECGMRNAEVGNGDASNTRSATTSDSPPLFIPHSPFRIPHSPPPLFICLDKHGGRNRYAALVQHHFPESWIETIDEGRGLSRYRWRHGEREVEAIFRVGCEELLPTALASMTAKYHRELAMRAFNAFWTARLPALRPTAGYPADARRFKADIAAVQQELEIEDRVLWRCR